MHQRRRERERERVCARVRVCVCACVHVCVCACVCACVSVCKRESECLSRGRMHMSLIWRVIWDSKKLFFQFSSFASRFNFFICSSNGTTYHSSANKRASLSQQVTDDCKISRNLSAKSFLCNTHWIQTLLLRQTGEKNN